MSRANTLETREQRAKLKPRHEPYWRSITRGVAIGYRKGPDVSQWYVRRYSAAKGAAGTQGDGQYSKATLGTPDDTVPADGVKVLTWGQVLRRALSDEVQAEIASKAAAGRFTVAEAMVLYFDHRRAKSLSAGSVEIDAGRMRGHVIGSFGDAQVAELTTEDLARWRDDLVAKAQRDATVGADETDRREAKRRAQATADRTWRIFRAALNYAFATGRVPSDHAWRKLKSYRNIDKPRDRFLSVDECRRLLNACPPDFRALVRGAMLTGLRYGEITRLKAADYADAMLVVPSGKPGKSRRLPLTSEGVEFFDEVSAGKLGTEYIFVRADGEPWGPGEQSRRMTAACTAARIAPRVVFHVLRHTYGSLLVNRGGSLHVISKALGHADTRMTARVYAHLQDDVIRRALEKALPRIGRRKASKVTRLDRAKRARS